MFRNDCLEYVPLYILGVVEYICCSMTAISGVKIEVILHSRLDISNSLT